MRPMPTKIEEGASRRARESKGQERDVRDAIRRRRPLEAEDEPERKIAYIQRRVCVGRDVAARIASYQPPDTLPLSPGQKAEAESLQGNTVDFVPMFFLDLARAAARSVARVASSSHDAIGSGFMVTPSLFLTNHHVIRSEEEALAMALEFNYEATRDLGLRPVTRFMLDPKRFFLTDDEDDLDYTLIAVGKRIDGNEDLGAFGFLPLIDADDKHVKGMFVNVIQHPEGRPKELVVRENRIVARTLTALLYGADTLPGSSGSPVFNDSFEAIALHHWGSPHRAKLDPLDGPGALPTTGNEGIRVSAILKELRGRSAGLDAAKSTLLREALNPPFRAPSLARTFLERSNGIMANPESIQATPFQLSEDGTATLTVPLTISMRLGNPPAPSTRTLPAPSPVAPEQRTGGSEAFPKPDPHYSNRRGYNPKFLGTTVDLPKLTTQQKGAAAKNKNAKAGDNPFEVKYENFSVVMNGPRQLPFFTAVNIDGASVVHINRDTGVVTSSESLADEGAEGHEKWYGDDRVDASQQSDQTLYDDPAMGQFQRGHLVKRTDPSWGSDSRAIRAQADTFHFTNCSPQHELFNPKTTRWAGVENWITSGSDKQDMRVSVFSGPVFAAGDRKFATIQVPRAYWKVVARVEDGELLATAILADQGDLLDEMQESLRGREDLPSFPTQLPKEYQVTVKHIEALTKLDFGSLRDHDTFSGGESARSTVKPIHAFEEISVDSRKGKRATSR